MEQMDEVYNLIRGLEDELKKDFPDLRYSKHEFHCDDFEEAAGLYLRIKEDFRYTKLIDAGIAYSDKNTHLNHIMIHSERDERAQALSEKVKQFFSENKIPF